MASTIPDVPFLERHTLVSALCAHHLAARAGSGRMVVVSGEAGAGKTSLVQTAFPAAVWGYCEPLTTPRPLGPFRDIATTLGGSVPARRSALADRLLGLMNARDNAVWVIEDAHWLDTASGEVLRFLGRRVTATHGLLVVVARDEQPFGVLSQVLGELVSAVERVEVPALTDSEVELLTVGSGLDAREVMRLTDGNAFLVGQLASGRTGRPAMSVRDAVAARLAPLTAPAQEVIQLLSVMPGRVPAEVITDWPSVDELVLAGLLVADGTTVRFRHELLRLAVEDAIPPGRSSQLHGTVLGTLGPSAEPAQVAHHARLAHRMDISLPAEIAAAVRAAAVGSHREAAAHYRRGVADARTEATPAERARLLIRLAEQERGLAHDDEARAAADEASVLSAAVGDPLLRSAVALMRSRLAVLEAGADDLARAAVAFCEPLGPSTELAAAYAALATHRMVARDLTVAVRHAHRALALAEQLGDIESQVVSASALGSSQLLSGDPSGEGPLRRAIHLAAAAGLDLEVGRAYANLVSAAGEARMYELSATAGREAVRYFTARDLDAWENYTRAWTARCLFEQGRWDEAEAELATLRATPRSTNAITDLMTCYLTVRLCARRGSATPLGLIARAESLANRTGGLQRLAPVAAAHAEADWLAGLSCSSHGLQEVYQLALARRDTWATGELGFWRWRAGELDELPPTAAEPYRLHVAGAHADAAEAWSALGCPYEAAEALADSADEGELRRALQILTQLGARPARQRVTRRLRELGVRSVPRGPRPPAAADPAGLTARESEVLVLLTRGRTDREIAAGLQLSVRTVGHHVSSILRKTGAGNRRELRP